MGAIERAAFHKIVAAIELNMISLRTKSCIIPQEYSSDIASSR